MVMKACRTERASTKYNLHKHKLWLTIFQNHELTCLHIKYMHVFVLIYEHMHTFASYLHISIY